MENILKASLWAFTITLTIAFVASAIIGMFILLFKLLPSGIALSTGICITGFVLLTIAMYFDKNSPVYKGWDAFK